MSEFVDECRREWRRLGVPDPVANEMAADLTADLDEAEAEGRTPEDVLGNSAFDPRRFAAAWATARGVTNVPVLSEPLGRRRQPVVIALVAAAVVLAVCAGIALLGTRVHSSVAIAVRRSALVPLHMQLIRPGLPPALRFGKVGGFLSLGQNGGMDLPLLALLLFILGVIGIFAAGLVAAHYGYPWWERRRSDRHRGGPRTPSWS